MTFGRSVDPIVTLEHAITRMAVATEAEAEKQGGDNRTMGRKNTVPYGLYVAHGFVSPALARQTGFDENDLELLWQALTDMFEYDRSAARGMMATQKLKGLDIIDESFTTFGVTKVMINNVDYETALEFSERIKEIKGVSRVDFYDTFLQN